MKLTPPLLSGRFAGPLAPTQPEATRSILGWGFRSTGGAPFSPQNFPGYWTLHMAEMAQAVYGKELDVRMKLVSAGNLFHLRWFDMGSTQAVGYFHQGHACLVFRGTEPNKLEDWLVDANLLMCESPGRHLGFQRAWRLIQPEVLDWLGQIRAALNPLTSSMGFSSRTDIRLVLGGHSLGGALAVLAAWELSADNTIAAVRTFGAPRVGSPEFAKAYRDRILDGVTIQLWHDADVVPFVPPPLLFQHVKFPLRVSGTAYRGVIVDESPRDVFGAIYMYLANMSGVGVSWKAYNKDPMVVLVLTLISIAVLYTSFVAASVRWVHHLAHSVLATRPGFGILFGLAVGAFQQLSFALPIRMKPIVRWLLAITAISVLCVIHTNLLVFAQVVVWILVGVLFLLRILAPSVSDHSMDGYIEALSRPFNYDRFAGWSGGNTELYRTLGLELPAFDAKAIAPTDAPVSGANQTGGGIATTDVKA